ncbi:phytanoyl-CoA dioxygenase family protein [Gammaproteobacteria bacterium]|nr:phytanoyl-CoA dioxygenase family protein [Gammaproteobacteria bacterium]
MTQYKKMLGNVDCIEADRIIGWAWCSSNPLAPVAIDLLVNGKRVHTEVASKYREDLKSAGFGNGCHGFEIVMSDGVLEKTNLVEVQFSNTGINIPGSPQNTGNFYCGMTDPPRYQSQFGGLWIDLSNACDVIKGKRMLGFVSDAEASQLEQFKNNGFIILEQAVSTDLISLFLEDIEGLWAGSTDTKIFCETYEEGFVKVSPLKPNYRDQLFKILDLHSHFASARHLEFSEPVFRFLSLVFERPPLAFQSLYFQRGVNQPIHQDTAYVRVSSPLEMVASWIALEDIQPGSGELEYYVGSQRLEDFMFGGNQKWMPPESNQHEKYLASLHEESEKLGLKRESFLPKKGDVLIWAADFAHGGTTVTRKDLTRKALVTHYCPVDCDPIYGDNIECKKIPYNDKGYYSAVNRNP